MAEVPYDSSGLVGVERPPFVEDHRDPEDRSVFVVGILRDCDGLDRDILESFADHAINKGFDLFHRLTVTPAA